MLSLHGFLFQRWFSVLVLGFCFSVGFLFQR